MVQVLHLADAHLDTAFDGRSAALRSHLREALRTAFRRAVDCAIDEEVDAVLIAGDLFDDDRLRVTTETFLADQLARLSSEGIAVVYSTGNHDPGGSGHRAAKMDWPEGVHYVDSRSPTRIEIGDAEGPGRATVVAAGHVSAQEQDNLAAQFPEAEDDGLHVGLLHAHVTSAAQVEAHDRYAPCSVDDLAACGYDYWALGHVHTRQRVSESPTAWYPGNLQGRTPRETGPRGGLLVTLRSDRAPDVEFRPFAPTRWEHLTLDALEEVETMQVLLRALQDAYEKRAEGSEASDWLVRVDLTGPCPLADDLADPDQVDELERVAADRLGVLDVEVRTHRLSPPIDVEVFRGETHLAGEVLSVLDAARTDESILDAVAPDELAGASSDAPEERRVYLRRLLEGLDREALARLVKEEGRTR